MQREGKFGFILAMLYVSTAFVMLGFLISLALNRNDLIFLYQIIDIVWCFVIPCAIYLLILKKVQPIFYKYIEDKHGYAVKISGAAKHIRFEYIPLVGAKKYSPRMLVGLEIAFVTTLAYLGVFLISVLAFFSIVYLSPTENLLSILGALI